MLQRLKFDLVDLSNEMLDQLPEHIFKSKTTTYAPYEYVAHTGIQITMLGSWKNLINFRM